MLPAARYGVIVGGPARRSSKPSEPDSLDRTSSFSAVTVGDPATTRFSVAPQETELYVRYGHVPRASKFITPMVPFGTGELLSWNT